MRSIGNQSIIVLIWVKNVRVILRARRSQILSARVGTDVFSIHRKIIKNQLILIRYLATVLNCSKALLGGLNDIARVELKLSQFGTFDNY